MVKLSKPPPISSDPSYKLLSLKFGTQQLTLPGPNWLASALLKLSTPPIPNVQSTFPLPPKVLKSIQAHDTSVMVNRLKVLSLSTSQQQISKVVPSAKKDNVCPYYFRRDVQKECIRLEAKSISAK